MGRRPVVVADPTVTLEVSAPRCQSGSRSERWRRTRLQQAAAKAAGIGLVGGSILVNAKGVRHNTALLIDANGSITGTWEKAHIPDEPGFWEADHYERGETPLAALDGLGFCL